ncbi:FAD-binding oxidoreductase [Galbibacter pacificus]|uniref:FAD-binding oxidoreductase n=1 Tax=Galbibacter pacificus TaxID=2996052 RepID=A0ABT6FVT2_9FLAO|nr:FAD-binding oxidoreductase [Galbibacter pacificus]MDG3583885.1 FAD-binding oxidoreductase [Galbibacter pacificus]MDG3587197.1 FAD-binding oxidoreductase [Galbibacter pacificus]
MEPTIKELKHKIEGNVILPIDDNYDEARKIHNAMIDKRPSIIIKCRNNNDVIQAINYAKENSLEISIRSGGHNGPGLALCNNGLVIDLSCMKEIKVNAKAQTAKVQSGCTWGEVDAATQKYGLATVSGIISTTGVGGLTLGGGHGYLTRKYGLTIDNLLEAEVVLANGHIVKASKEQHPDLFWALRGGGGNFGVVTSFTYKLHPVDSVIAGPMFWTIDKLEPTLKWYREWLPNAPEEIGTFYLIAEVPSADPFPEAIRGEKVCGLMWSFIGTEQAFNPIIQEARNIAEPLFEFTGPIPYTTLQSMFDGLYPKGHQQYWKGDFVHELSDKAIHEHLNFSQVPTSQSCMHLYPIDGAVHRVGKNETAWNMRDANWSMVIFGVDPDPANKEKITDWARAYWEALHPFHQNGAYVNFMMEEGENRVKATYGDNYDRLQKVKATYDPDNFFHVNQNIKPKE